MSLTKQDIPLAQKLFQGINGRRQPKRGRGGTHTFRGGNRGKHANNSCRVQKSSAGRSMPAAVSFGHSFVIENPGARSVCAVVIPNPVDASAEDPLTLSLSPQARLGELASQRGRIRKRMRLGERTLEHPLRIVQASLLPWGEGQDEGGLREAFNRIRYYWIAAVAKAASRRRGGRRNGSKRFRPFQPRIVYPPRTIYRRA